MRIFGVQVPFTGKQEKAMSPASGGRGWWPMIRESFTGAWQQNMEERVDTLIQYPTLYACISRVAQDIGKLPFLMKAKQSSGIWIEVVVEAVNRVLQKPNHYQTHQQFREAWQLSKLTQGNTYILKARNGRGVVVALYVLDPMRVMPLVSDSGEVFYQLYVDNLNMLTEENELLVAASEIIHDRCICPFHPLIGLPPIAAANWPALKNLRILRSSAEFFGNGAQPSGILSAPGAIGDDTAKRLSAYWNDNFSGKNSGKVAVVGDNLKFESLSAKSVDAQMVEQLRYSDEQICQPFGIPPFKVGIGSIPAGLKVDDINQLYYSDALQASIEAMETLLDEGLGVPDRHGIELDLWPLLRMDMQKQAEVEGALVKGSIKKIDEARRNFDLPPVDGGDSIYMQQQNYSLAALARRDAQANPFSPAATEAPSEPVELTDEEINEQARMLAFLIEKEMVSADHA